MNIQVGDVLVMKKPHPCGEHRFTVGRVGMDFRIRCTGCGREVMVPRAKVEKNIRKVLRDGAELSVNDLKPQHL
ncbi:MULTISPECIES: DUF951 domain-containing protein [Anaerotruncus]|jgi:hypothetical protein|uniref:DUF951 domain-containing protein n=1 Tax=Anaerotruncus TaxID=244127 RepID=UPI0008345CF2|nr:MULTISPECIES: DUF951 domain-containing protein [Anaerotruncus]RGX54309.1 DUF951 domain-containing protein [Anaerotruncus sp. AF02-27]